MTECSCNSGVINSPNYTLHGRIYNPTMLKGDPGKSAYEVAVEAGFEGTVEEWLQSLCGPAGKSAYQTAVDLGFEGTEEEWLASLHGADGSNGESAYDIAVQQGFVGTVDEWLASLHGAAGPQGEPGPQGPDGRSAYQVAVDNGFVGTEEEWLASLKGKDGKDGKDGSGGGVTSHVELEDLDAPDSHPISAITGLEDSLANLQTRDSELAEEISGKADEVLIMSVDDILDICK